MKKLLLLLLCVPMIGFGQNVYIPDANFKAYLVGNNAINTNGDSAIQVSEASAYNGTISCSSMNISDLTGIEEFTALVSLDINNSNISSLDLSNNILLKYLYILIKIDFVNYIFLFDIQRKYARNGSFINKLCIYTETRQES